LRLGSLRLIRLGQGIGLQRSQGFKGHALRMLLPMLKAGIRHATRANTPHLQALGQLLGKP
jgi:hypothetical protein